MLVRDFKATEGFRFDSRFLDCLPDYCLVSSCGSPTEMTETLTSLRCSNPRCPTKVVNRLCALLSSIGVKDMGESRASAFIQSFGITNPLLIFAYDPEEDGAMAESISLAVSSKIAEQVKSKKSFTLWEYVRCANLPHIQTSAMHIFSEFDDLTEAYEKIEKGGYEYVREKLSIKKGSASSSENLEDGDISIRALKVFESLMTFKSDLFEALPFVNIVKTHTEDMLVLKAVCSEEVGVPFKTKADFYATVNNLYPNIHVEFLNSVTKSIDYLVWAGADGNSSVRVTNKVNKVLSYNETYEKHKNQEVLKDGEHYIPIVTASQFIHILEKKQESLDEVTIEDN